MNGYKNESGGNFRDEQWTTALPTDSQILSSIFINYIDYLYREAGILRDICIKWPVPASNIY